MSIDLIAIRGSGLVDGGEIFDTLLCTNLAALARAEQEINANTPVTPVTLDVTYRPGVRRGQMVEVNDAYTGVSWRGIILGLHHVVSSPGIYTKLEIERCI